MKFGAGYAHPTSYGALRKSADVGTIGDADGVGVVGTPASGEMMKLTIRVVSRAGCRCKV